MVITYTIYSERGGDGCIFLVRKLGGVDKTSNRDILNRHLAEDEDDEEDDNGDGLVPRGPPTRPTCPPLQQVAASRLEKKGASTRNQSVPEPTPAIQASDGSPIAGFNDGGVLPRGPQERQEPIQTPRFKRVAAVS